MILRLAPFVLFAVVMAAPCAQISLDVEAIGEVGIEVDAGSGPMRESLTGSIDQTTVLRIAESGWVADLNLAPSPESFVATLLLSTPPISPVTMTTVGGPAPATAVVPQFYSGEFTAPVAQSGVLVVRVGLRGADGGAGSARVSVLGQVTEADSDDVPVLVATPVTVGPEGIEWTAELSASLSNIGAIGGLMTATIDVRFSTDRCYSTNEAISCFSGGNHGVEVGGAQGDELTFLQVPFFAGAPPVRALLFSPFGGWAPLPPNLGSGSCRVLAFVPLAVPMPDLDPTGSFPEFRLTVPPAFVGSMRSQVVSIRDGQSVIETTNIARTDCVY